MRLKLLEPLEGNVQPAKRRVGIAQFLVAVPVPTAADGHAETLCDSGEPALRAGRMARVPHLEAVETLFVELPDLAFGAGGRRGGRATATPPTACTSSATCDKVGSGFST